ncbi:DNA-directed RNA polymerase II, putative [Bodo saltans]|uniref:DNA-directed RNA polymerases I, II, and III subunit RPABC5 n=1 Tax=Bodo saltans TaxID=75058 RepID=A0A0S4JEQ2_BODSA|nr:DNA-directed RNA polymerase II, putative [Bodo saltans]|eukprot:CUG87648.1 DNA-directed RNA polymerase II, putative [Bodo saltans]
MIIPVRCFTCGKVIADIYETYLDLQREGADEEKALDALGLTRFCCRRMLLTHVDFSDTLQKFNPADHAHVLQIHERRQ